MELERKVRRCTLWRGMHAGMGSTRGQQCTGKWWCRTGKDAARHRVEVLLCDRVVLALALAGGLHPGQALPRAEQVLRMVAQPVEAAAQADLHARHAHRLPVPRCGLPCLAACCGAGNGLMWVHACELDILLNNAGSACLPMVTACITLLICTLSTPPTAHYALFRAVPSAVVAIQVVVAVELKFDSYALLHVHRLGHKTCSSQAQAPRGNPPPRQEARLPMILVLGACHLWWPAGGGEGLVAGSSCCLQVGADASDGSFGCRSAL